MSAGPYVLLVYRDPARSPLVGSAVGLGVCALHTVRVLRRAGVASEAISATEPSDVRGALTARPAVTHCVLEAPWVGLDAMVDLLHAFPRVHFLVRCHSQIGFLQVDPTAIQVLRDFLVLQETVLNLSVATNSVSLKRFFEAVYGGHALYLPNLYDTDRVGQKPTASLAGRALRVGSFGALRVLKNHTSAAAAALMLARKSGAALEFSISVESTTEGGLDIRDALRNMFADLAWAKLIEHPWQDWATFRRTVAEMDLCLHVSMTETFNITTADAVAEGVPCVVTPAIEWAPDYWKADPDRLEDIARIGAALLSNHDAASDGLAALSDFVEHATDQWIDYLAGPPDRHVAAG